MFAPILASLSLLAIPVASFSIVCDGNCPMGTKLEFPLSSSVSTTVKYTAATCSAACKTKVYPYYAFGGTTGCSCGYYSELDQNYVATSTTSQNYTLGYVPTVADCRVKTVTGGTIEKMQTVPKNFTTQVGTLKSGANSGTCAGSCYSSVETSFYGIGYVSGKVNSTACYCYTALTLCAATVKTYTATGTYTFVNPAYPVLVL